MDSCSRLYLHSADDLEVHIERSNIHLIQNNIQAFLQYLNTENAPQNPIFTKIRNVLSCYLIEQISIEDIYNNLTNMSYDDIYLFSNYSPYQEHAHGNQAPPINHFFQFTKDQQNNLSLRVYSTKTDSLESDQQECMPVHTIAIKDKTKLCDFIKQLRYNYNEHTLQFSVGFLDAEISVYTEDNLSPHILKHGSYFTRVLYRLLNFYFPNNKDFERLITQYLTYSLQQSNYYMGNEWQVIIAQHYLSWLQIETAHSYEDNLQLEIHGTKLLQATNAIAHTQPIDNIHLQHEDDFYAYKTVIQLPYVAEKQFTIIQQQRYTEPNFNIGEYPTPVIAATTLCTIIGADALLNPIWILYNIEQFLLYLKLPKDQENLYQNFNKNDWQELSKCLWQLSNYYIKTLTNKHLTPKQWITIWNFIALQDYYNQQISQKNSIHILILAVAFKCNSMQNVSIYTNTADPKFDERWQQIQNIYKDTSSILRLDEEFCGLSTNIPCVYKTYKQYSVHDKKSCHARAGGQPFLVWY